MPDYTEDDMTSILINGQRFDILPNLLNALYRLREDSSRSAPALLWIDAICINQNDPSERASQVEIMDQVYKRASFTFVWLGEPRTVLEKGRIGVLFRKIMKIPYDEVREMASSFPNTRPITSGDNPEILPTL